jgi:hypothetical protein
MKQNYILLLLTFFVQLGLQAAVYLVDNKTNQPITVYLDKYPSTVNAHQHKCIDSKKDAKFITGCVGSIKIAQNTQTKATYAFKQINCRQDKLVVFDGKTLSVKSASLDSKNCKLNPQRTTSSSTGSSAKGGPGSQTASSSNNNDEEATFTVQQSEHLTPAEQAQRQQQYLAARGQK